MRVQMSGLLLVATVLTVTLLVADASAHAAMPSCQTTVGTRQEAARAARAAADASRVTTAPSPRTPVNEQRDVVIRLERTPCFGSCPAYTVTILGDRSVTFVAHDGRATASPGEWSCCDLVRKKVLPLADYNRLVAQIDAMHFFQLKSDYSAEITDLPGVTIMSATPNGVHSVRRYAVPCETEYRKRTTAKRSVPGAPDPDDYLKGVVPPPDSLCKLESMIDQLTGAAKWGEDTKFHWRGK